MRWSQQQPHPGQKISGHPRRNHHRSDEARISGHHHQDRKRPQHPAMIRTSWPGNHRSHCTRLHRADAPIGHIGSAGRTGPDPGHILREPGMPASPADRSASTVAGIGVLDQQRPHRRLHRCPCRGRHRRPPVPAAEPANAAPYYRVLRDSDSFPAQSRARDSFSGLNSRRISAQSSTVITLNRNCSLSTTGNHLLTFRPEPTKSGQQLTG